MLTRPVRMHASVRLAPAGLQAARMCVRCWWQCEEPFPPLLGALSLCVWGCAFVCGDGSVFVCGDGSAGPGLASAPPCCPRPLGAVAAHCMDGSSGWDVLGSERAVAESALLRR